jgi:hypothetical protein
MTTPARTHPLTFTELMLLLMLCCFIVITIAVGHIAGWW